MTVQPSFVPKPSSNRGPADSEDYNDMIAALLYDNQAFATQINTNEAQLLATNRLLFNEFMNARNSARSRFEGIRENSLVNAKTGADIYNLVNFRTFRGPEYYITQDDLATARRARVSPQYGHVLLPYNRTVNRMFTINSETGEAVTPFGIDVEITGVNDGSASSIDNGTPTNMFNGSNRDYWVRKVEFPVESDISSVGVEVLVTLPDDFADRINMMTLHAYPLEQLDIESIYYSLDASDPTTLLTDFTTVRGAGFERWHFSGLAITKLKVTMRQRNFIEEDGKKVFYIGAQELDMQLVEFDQTAGEVQLTDNNGLVVVLEAPEGYKFDVLKRLHSTPAYATALVETGVRIYIFANEGLTTQLWSSYDDQRLEDLNVDVSSQNADKLYMLVTLQFLTASSKSPVLDDILIGYSVTT